LSYFRRPLCVQNEKAGIAGLFAHNGQRAIAAALHLRLIHCSLRSSSAGLQRSGPAVAMQRSVRVVPECFKEYSAPRAPNLRHRHLRIMAAFPGVTSTYLKFANIDICVLSPLLGERPRGARVRAFARLRARKERSQLRSLTLSLSLRERG